MIQGDVPLAAQAQGTVGGFLLAWQRVLRDGGKTSRSGKGSFLNIFSLS